MKKTLISIRLDSDLLHWYREKFDGYQSKIQHVLNCYRRECELEESRLAGQLQEVYRKYYAQCFWHLDRDLVITPKHFGMIREGLKKYGGREGYTLAALLFSDKKGA